MALLLLAKKSDFFLKYADVYARSATIKVTDRCNSKCITCDVWKRDSSKENEMNTKEFFDVLDDLREIGCNSIQLTGGEALIRDDISELIDYASSLKMKTGLATNGLLLEKKAGSLENLDHLAVSVDGMRETNDEIRGIEGDFKKSINGIKKYKKVHDNPSIAIATTIISKNIPDIPALVKLCNKLGIKWHPNLLDTNLYFLKDTDFSDFEVKNRKKGNEFIEILKRLWEEYSDTININKKQVEHIEQYLKEGKYPEYCILGYDKIRIEANGDVRTGCWVLPPIGNAKENNLEKIISSEEYKKRVRKMFKRDCPQCTCGWGANVKFEAGIL